jgi:hypothetical protein
MSNKMISLFIDGESLKCVFVLIVFSFAMTGHSEPQYSKGQYSEELCSGDDGFSWPESSQRSGLDVSCLAYAGTLPLGKYKVVDVRTNASLSQSLGPIKGARQMTVPELKYRKELKKLSLLLVDEGFDTALMNYYCHTLKRSGFTDVKIAVGGVASLLQARASLSTQSDISELVYLTPRQAFSVLDGNGGHVVTFDDNSDKSQLPANTIYIERADAIAELTRLQSRIANVAEWQPVLLVGSDADYQFYLAQRKKPLAGVYLLRGGLSAYESYKQERHNILARKELNKVPPCQRR